MPSIHAPSSFITATLTWLPQPPSRSLLLVRLRENSGAPGTYAIQALHSHDLYSAEGQLATAAILSTAQHLCTPQPPDAAAVVIIDEPPPHRPGSIPALSQLAMQLRGTLTTTGTPLVGAWTITTTEPGSAWVSLLDDNRGVLTSAPPEPPARPRRDTGVGHDLASAAVDVTAGRSAPGDDPNAFADQLDQARVLARRRLRLVLCMVYAVNAGVELRIDRLAEVAEALEDPAVRDVLYAFAVGRNGPTALKLWTLLIRELPIRRRGVPAMLATLTHYTSSDYTSTGETSRIALTQQPDDPSLQTPAAAITATDPAELLRAIAHSGRCTAADLGIDID
ncbi:DUF4192 family protein [Nocardia xishanensis]|uniref:DUF4192 family protein n=1 Tax=Nocardia xishanensis TaxID=238964 RepID=UPI0009FE8322|nr:DUF4192 family protein [Nocardia xishanensis]